LLAFFQASSVATRSASGGIFSVEAALFDLLGRAGGLMISGTGPSVAHHRYQLNQILRHVFNQLEFTVRYGSVLG
jgi:hypothetical protein